ncbi:MAG: ribonuclease, partial [Acidobacteriaceae bacterium]
MSKEICVSSTPHETRLAILEDDQLTEVYYERENEYTLAGSIYKGRVTRVLPGMQSAFVDLGLERDAFLYVTDCMEEQEDSSEFERIPANGEEPARPQQARQPRVAEEPKRNGSPSNVSQGQSGQAAEGEFEDGTRRWRGRRGRRKGFRPEQGSQPTGQETSSRSEVPSPAEPTPEPQPVEIRPQGPIALPGESLSKYGIQSPASATPVENRTPQPRPNMTLAKPSTLVETPIQWDGEGLLAGESISRYRQPAHEAPAPFLSEVAASDSPEAEVELEQEELEVFSAAVDEPITLPEDEILDEPAAPEAFASAAEPAVEAHEEVHTHSTSHFPEEPVAEFEPDEASASYRVDPSAPSEFRFASPSATSLVEEQIELGIEEQIELRMEDQIELRMEDQIVQTEEAPEPHHPSQDADHQSASATTDVIAPDNYLDDLDEELEDDTPEVGLVEEEEVTDEEEYDFNP